MPLLFDWPHSLLCPGHGVGYCRLVSRVRVHVGRSPSNQAWGQPAEGLSLTTLLALVLANLVDLIVSSTIGSAGFLLMFAAVNAANPRPSVSIEGWPQAHRSSSQIPPSATRVILCVWGFQNRFDQHRVHPL